MDRVARCAKTIGGCHLLGLCLVVCLLPVATIAQTVTVANFSFSPNSISITAGQTVTWSWASGTHNVDSGSSCTSDGLFSSATQSSGTYLHQFTAAGTYNYFCDPHCLSNNMTGSVTVNPGPANFLIISGAPGSVTAGNSFSVTVTAYDAYGNVATGFGGTVFFTSTDGQAVLPSSTLSGGVGSFNITLKTAGFQNLTANASGVSSYTVFSIDVVHAAANHFLVSAPGSATAGTPFAFTVTAQDPYGNTDPTFGGTVSFTSTDPQAVLPAPNTLVSGTRSFNATLKTSGNRTITATSGITGTSNAINVIAAAATHYTISAPPTVSAGASFSVTVTALDTFNNIATGYAGTVHFTSSDGAAVLPANSGLINGTGIFAVTLNTLGSESITATDTVSSGLTATANVLVSPPCPAAAKTFSNPAPITFSTDGISATTSPYPSPITVSGMNGQVVSKITLTLKGLTFASCPADLALLLQGPTGKFMIPFSLIGPCSGSVSGINLTLDDAAASQLPEYPNALTSGTFKPSGFSVSFFAIQPAFQVPAPAPPYSTSQLAATDGTATFASVFTGSDPNGVWNLYVLDQTNLSPPADNGQLAGGWSLTITPGYLFTNPSPIVLNSGVPNPPTTTNPYPSAINVSGVPGNISKMTMTLKGLTDKCPADLALLLQGSQGQLMVPLSEVGGCTLTTATVGDLILDDAATSALPPWAGNNSAALPAGTYRPSSYLKGFSGIEPAFLPSAPPGPYPKTATDGTATFANTFNGTDPNGTCNLYVQEQFGGGNFDVGQFANGWSLLITASCPVGTSASVTPSANPSVFGQSVTFTATITSAGGTPFGTVTFKDGATTLGTATLSGSPATASFTTSGLALGSHSITAIYGGNTSFATSASAILPQVVNKAATVMTAPGSSANPSTFGSAVTFTSTVAVVSPGAGTPTGTVTFMDGGTPIGSGVIAGGSASYTTTATQLGGGGHSITAVYSGDTNFTGSPSSAPLTQTVNTAGTAVGLTTSGTPSVYGVNVTFKATVSNSTTVTATGTVTFRDSGTPISGLIGLASGVASFTTNALNVSGSPHSITATYNGDVNFSISSSSPVSQTVTRASTATGVTTSISPTVFGQAVTFTATVVDTTSGSTGTPTGTVSFTDVTTSTLLGSKSLTGGTAALTTASLGAGVHSIQAAYSGDSNFTVSTGTTAQTVLQAATSVSVPSPGPSTYGQGVTFTANISVNFPGAGSTSGSVTFKEGAVTLGSGTVVNNVASYTTTTTQLAGGSHSITAVYSGDGNFTGSNSSFTQVVNPAGSSTKLNPSSPSLFGQPVTFTAVVSTFVAGGATATGIVTFKDGTVVLGTGTLSASPATAVFTTTTSLAVGTHHITGVYSGDANYSTSTSLQISQVITQASVGVTLTQSASVSIFREPFTLNVSVVPIPPGAGTPTGTVTFMDGTATLGVGTLSAGQASITVSTGLPVGYRTLTAVYGGDANFSGTTSSSITHRRSPAPHHIPNP